MRIEDDEVDVDDEGDDGTDDGDDECEYIHFDYKLWLFDQFNLQYPWAYKCNIMLDEPDNYLITWVTGSNF